MQGGREEVALHLGFRGSELQLTHGRFRLGLRISSSPSETFPDFRRPGSEFFDAGPIKDAFRALWNESAAEKKLTNQNAS